MNLNLDRPLFAKKFRLAVAVSGLMLLLGNASPLLGQTFYTYFSDGFGDGDLDNNGVALDAHDARQGSYIPNQFGVFDGPIDPVTMMPTETGPRIPSLQQEVTGGTLTLDPTDVGAKWFGTAGFSNGGTGAAKAEVKIVHDTTAAVPVDMANPFSRFPGPDPAITTDASGASVPNLAALDTGLALGVELKGGGSSAAGFFGQTINLGPAIGDQLRVGLDFRAWISAPNANSDTSPPTAGSLRWGIFGDTDGELGQTGNHGVSNTPAVWGESNGDWRDATPGAAGDAGFYTQVQIGDISNPDLFFFPDGREARIRDESNAEGFGDRFLEGGSDFIAGGRTDATGVLTDTFLGLDNSQAYRLELTLERVVPSDPLSTATEAIAATYTITNLNDPTDTHTISGEDRLRDRNGDTIPDDAVNYFGDSFDYFAIRGTGTQASNDWDFIIDNVLVESTVPNIVALPCDLDGDGDCDPVDIELLLDAGTDVTAIGQWLTEASDAANPYLGGAKTFLIGDANLDGNVDSTDLGLHLNNFGSTTSLDWLDGNFNGDAVVDSVDLGLHLNNFGSTSAAASAVPEPSAGILMMLGVVVALLRRRR